MSRVELWFDQDMNQPVKMRALTGSAFSLDSQGTQIGVRCYKNGAPFTGLTGSVSGRFVLPNGESFSNVSGVRSGNEVYIRIPQSALLISGQIGIFIKLTDGSVITTLGAFTATVITTQTGTVITPSSTVIQDWTSEISTALQEMRDDLAAEAATRAAADTAESTARANADAAEAATRAAADSTLQSNIDSEASARAAADTAEEAARQAADVVLQTNIITVQANLDKLGLYIDTDGYMCHKLSGE